MVDNDTAPLRQYAIMKMMKILRAAERLQRILIPIGRGQTIKTKIILRAAFGVEYHVESCDTDTIHVLRTERVLHFVPLRMAYRCFLN